MKIALAQIKPEKGDISKNITSHGQLINQAVEAKADAIFFPELSLTGYEPTLAEQLATDIDDNRLGGFQALSDQHYITIGLGLPTRNGNGMNISMAIFEPNSARKLYSKQQLHEDELPYFMPGNRQVLIEVKKQKIAPAICYESLQPGHATNAVELGAQIYLASVAKSKKGVAKAMKHFPEIAKRFDLPVLMVNCVGFCDNFESAGGTAAWTAQGQLISQIDSDREGILIVDLDKQVAEKVTL